MTTNELKMFRIEYYDDDQADESDPDPVFTAEADNTDDLWTALANTLVHVQDCYDPTYIYADLVDRDLRYHVYDNSRKRPIGVAIIVYP